MINSTERASVRLVPSEIQDERKHDVIWICGRGKSIN